MSRRLTPNSLRRSRLENLEDRRLLAADGIETIDAEAVARTDAIAGLIAADVNADGQVSPVDALQIINYINASSSVESESLRNSVDELVDSVFDSVGRLDTDGNGEVTAVDALRVINRLNEGVESVVDAVMDRLPQFNREFASGVGGVLGGGEIGGNMRGLVGDLLSGLNTMRIRGDIPAERIARVIQGVAGIAGEAERPSTLSIARLVETARASLADRDLTTREMSAIRTDVTEVLHSAGVNTTRVNMVWDEVESIVRTAGVETEDVRRVLDRVQRIVENLPGRAIADLPALSRPLADIADTLARLGSQPDAGGELNSGGAMGILSTAGDLIDQIRAADLSLPSFSSVMNFAGDYLRARNDDGVIDRAELDGLAESVDVVFASMGLEESTRDQLVDRFVGLFNASR